MAASSSSASSSSLAAAFFTPNHDSINTANRHQGAAVFYPAPTNQYTSNPAFPSYPQNDQHASYQLPQQPHHPHLHHQFQVQDGPFRVPLPPRAAFPTGLTPSRPDQSASPADRFAMPRASHSLISNSAPAPYGQPLPSSSSWASFGGDLAGSSSMSDFSYSSYDMGGASSSSSSNTSLEQPDIDHLLAMSKAQADASGDANLFACPHCDKRYTGKHARSIWRRHLQDKHNIPLSIQPRRTRWDGDANRPKNAEERRARMLESKRRWARKKRLQEKLGNAASVKDEYDDGHQADTSNMSFESFNEQSPEEAPRQALQPTNASSANARWESPNRRSSDGSNPFLSSSGKPGKVDLYSSSPMRKSISSGSNLRAVPLHSPAAATESAKLLQPAGMPPKYDQQEAAIQLLALRSNSNSPTDADARKRRREEWDTPSRSHAALSALQSVENRETSPSPVSRTLAKAVPLATPGRPNPFSLDQHKISPFEGKRKLSFETSPGRPRLPPLVSTPVRDENDPPPPRKRLAPTPFSSLKTPALMRRPDQFSSPQHLNLTESLGLAPHSISRTSSYATLSLGLTPSFAASPFGAWPESGRKALGAGMLDEEGELADTPSKPRKARPLSLMR